MKKLLSIILASVLIVTGLAGCGKKDDEKGDEGSKAENKVYTAKDLTMYEKSWLDYVTLGDYQVEIAADDSHYKQLYKSYYSYNIYQNELYETDKTLSVKDGDVVYIQYIGQTIDDSQIFTGDGFQTDLLEIGSGQYVDGFEQQLIGAKIGSTVNVEVTFPKDYTSADLKGRKARFTVVIGGIIPEVSDAMAVGLGFKDTAAMEKELKKIALQQYFTEKLIPEKLIEFEIKSYPENLKKHYDDNYKTQISSLKEQMETYNKANDPDMTWEEFFTAETGYENEEAFKKYYYLLLDQELVVYAIFEKAELSYTQEEYDAFVIESAGGEEQVESFLEYYDAEVIEAQMVIRVVFEYLAENTVIK